MIKFAEILKVIFLGIVEGITEWLPISSTGHMLLVDEFIKLNTSDEFKEMFFVVIQLGAILAVVLLFWEKMFPFQWKDKSKPVIIKETFSVWFKVVVACIPGAVVTILFDDFIEAHLHAPVVIAATLILYGVAFIYIEEYNKKTSEQQTLIDQNLKENKLEIQKELDSLNKTFSKIQETFNKKFTTLSVEQKQTLDSMQKGQTESLSHIEKVQSEALEELSKSQTSFLNNVERTQSEKLDEIAKEHDEFLSKLSEEQNENLDSINTAIQLEKDALREQANVLDKKMKLAYIVAGSSAAITIIHVILNVLGVI